MARLNSTTSPAWTKGVLAAAAIYNIGWGAFVVVWPRVPFDWAGMDVPNYLSLWQCLGMVIGVYGIGYAIAACDPWRHWPLVLVGLLGKVFGPLGFVWAAAHGELPWRAGLMILANDLVWWLPFGVILWQAWRAAAKPQLLKSVPPEAGNHLPIPINAH